MFLNGYPYTDFHEMNLDFLLKSMRELQQAMETFKATESLKFADPIIWNITTQYEKSTVVLDPSGNAYLSLQPVPAGVQLNNTDYWLEIFNFTAYTRTANQNLTVNVETNTTRATVAHSVDDWLIWNDVLYNVTSAIAIDDAFIVYPEDGYNIKHFTVEDFIKAFITYATGLINQYKNDIDASELAFTNYLQDQFDQVLSGATVDSEVINARVSWDGVTYTTLKLAINTAMERIYRAINNDISYNQARVVGNTGVLSAYSQRVTTQLIPISKMKYVYAHTNLTYKKSFTIYRYSSAGYQGGITGGNDNDGYTWGTSSIHRYTGPFLFDRLKADYPNDYIRISFEQKDMSDAYQNITVDDVKSECFIFTDVMYDDDITTFLNIKNGRIDGSTGLISPLGNQLNRMITSDYIDIDAITKFSIDNESDYVAAIFLYDSECDYIGGITSNLTTTYNSLSTGGWCSDWNFEMLAATYPNHKIRIVLKNNASSNFDLSDIAPYLHIKYKSDKLVLFPHDNKNLIFSEIDRQFLTIAYSNVSGILDAPMNSLEHYRYVADDYGDIFNTIKGDARVTADDKVVMCHDAGFTLDGNGRIITFDSDNYTPIRSLTYDQCMALEYANQWHGDYCHVCDYHTFLAICKEYGKLAYTVVRDEYIDEALEDFFNGIYGLNMLNRTIINSFTYDSLVYFAKYDPDILVSWIVNNEELTGTKIRSMTRFNNSMLCLFDFGGTRTGFAALAQYKANGVLDYATNFGIRLHEAIADIHAQNMTNKEFISKLLEYNIIGSQINRLE